MQGAATAPAQSEEKATEMANKSTQRLQSGQLSARQESLELTLALRGPYLCRLHTPCPRKLREARARELKWHRAQAARPCVTRSTAPRTAQNPADWSTRGASSASGAASIRRDQEQQGGETERSFSRAARAGGCRAARSGGCAALAPKEAAGDEPNLKKHSETVTAAAGNTRTHALPAPLRCVSRGR
ncbi:hypothetical protein AOLI_G00207410 [Acnodon oligacanthus]